MRRSFIVLFVLISTLVLFTACSGKDDTKKEGKDGEKSTETSGLDGDLEEVPEPDLKGIPDIVAEINGEEVTKEEFEMTYEQNFQQVAMQSQLTGEEVDQDEFKTEIANSLVDQKLLLQEANKQVGEVSEKDIDATIDILLEQAQIEDKEELFTMLKEQGMEKEQAMEEIETQVKIEKLLESESGDIEPTEEELKESYNSLKEQQSEMGGEEEFPPYEDIKPELKDQVKGQKELEVAEKLIEKLREDAEIKIHI